MTDQNNIYQKIINLLDENRVEYKLFSHKEALSYEELAEVQKEAGFIGTEMKCLVLKVDDKFIVYITLQGEKINFNVIKERLKINKAKLCSPEDLHECFGAKPGCAYPFGFDDQFDIYVDPKIYTQDWLLFSPIFPTKTIQARGGDLRKVFDNLKNIVQEVSDFNLAAV